MLLKRHLCGIHVQYPEGCGNQSGKLIHGMSCGREQGSLYSQQKKRIADAVFRLQQTARPDCQPIIFVATSPGYVDRANEPKFVSSLVDNLRKGYGMERFLWVREFTGNGFPHFHFIANIPLKKRAKAYKWDGRRHLEIPFDPVKLSVYWSSLFDQDAKNSIRVGSKPNKYGQIMVYLSNSRRKAWYLAKYIGKSRSQDEVRSKAKIKAFHMDHRTSAEIEPELFTSKQVTETRAVAVLGKKGIETVYHDIPTDEIIFENERGELISPHGIGWRDVGHGCKVGFELAQDQNLSE